MFCLFFFIGNHCSRYDQSKMQSHLIQCFNYSKMEWFPSEIVPSLPIVKKEKIKLYCTCRMPHLEGENMAYCPKCHEWYHGSCEQIPALVFSNIAEKYICSKCVTL